MTVQIDDLNVADQEQETEGAQIDSETLSGGPEGDGNPRGDTFPRAYVEQLRSENAEARVKARRADDLSARLHGALVSATGRLADPTDLAYDETHIDDPDALNAAIDELIARKPHLASRTPRGSIGQGATTSAATVDLAGLLRSRA